MHGNNFLELDPDKATKKSQNFASRQFQKDKTKSREETLLSAQHVSDFLVAFTCYELMPQSSKVVVLDTNLTVAVAMQALDENDIHSALLWDTNESDFVGMISVTDFLHFVFQSYTTTSARDLSQTLVSLEKMKLKTCRGLNASKRPSQLVCIDPQDTLYEAVTLFVKYRIHRLPVIDRIERNSVLYVLAPQRILVFLMKVMQSCLPIFSQTIEQLNVGTFQNLATCSLETTLIDVLSTMVTRNISVLPVVNNENGVLVGAFYKRDFAYFANSSKYLYFEKPLRNIDVLPIDLQERKCTCRKTETLQVIINRLLEYRLQDLICVDDDCHPIGVISIGDLLRFFLQPRKNEKE
jgi:5'-AMP-activated protein kinase regulatory gamma subunit